MGISDLIKDALAKKMLEVLTKSAPEPVPEKKAKKARKPKEKTAVSKTEKDIATDKHEPWVAVTAVELDIDNISNGAFSLDWNDIFIARLMKAGYTGENDAAIVDQWFTSLCRNIVNEVFEQEMADPEKRANHLAQMI